MVAAVRSHRELEALPLMAPDAYAHRLHDGRTACAPSRALEAALAFLQTPEWQEQLQQHSGALGK